MKRAQQIFALGLALSSAAPLAAQQPGSAPAGKKDTVDVAIGSPVVNTSHIVAHRARTVTTRTVNGAASTNPDIVWSFMPHDTAGKSLLHIESAVGGQTTNTFELDGATLLPSMLNGAAFQLPAPSFLGGLADLLVEALPRKIGVVYRAPIWRRGMPSAEQHLYETTGREDITVLGHSHAQAWVVEDRSGDGSRLLGKLWLIDGPPFLVRWSINNPDGSTTQLEQELAMAGTAPTQSIPQRTAQPSTAQFVPQAISLKGRVSVPMQLVSGKRASVRAMINGRGPYLLSIETGGPYGLLINKKVARDLQLRTADDVPGGIARLVDSLQIGTMTMTGLKAVTRDDIGLPGVDGLLGLGAYQDLLLTVDYPARQVRFERDTLSAPNNRDILPLQRKGLLLAAPAVVDGKSVPLIVDTQGGDAQVFCTPEFADSMRFVSAPVIAGSGSVAWQERADFKQARLDGSVQLGGYDIQRPMVQLFPIPLPGPSCMIGTSLLSHFAVSLDQRTRRIRFASGTSIVPPSAPLFSLGASFSLPDSNAHIWIERVDSGGAAQAAGVHPHDELLEIGGMPASAQTTSRTALQELSARGKSVRFKIRRDNRVIELNVKPRLLVA